MTVRVTRVLTMASVGTWSMASRAHVSQVRSLKDLCSVPCEVLLPGRTPHHHNQEPKKKFKCPHDQRRECRLCYSCLLVFRATTHRKSPTQKTAYPLLLSEQRHYCGPHLLLCGMWKGQQSPSSCPGGGGEQQSC